MVDKDGTFNSTVTSYNGIDVLNGTFYEVATYIENAIVQWKGQESEYRKTLELLKPIDLSSNTLNGSIPNELYQLNGLVSLNLSRNHLTGKMDSNIGEMEMLECLDLSNNHISGAIPAGIANLSKLAVLNLSNNILSGRIPSGTQLDGLSASVYAGNTELCGSPVNLCPGSGPSHGISIDNSGKHGYSGEEDDVIVTRGFYISMAVDFVIGLWGLVFT